MSEAEWRKTLLLYVFITTVRQVHIKMMVTASTFNL